MKTKNLNLVLGLFGILLFAQACNIPSLLQKDANQNLPEAFIQNSDTTNSATIKYSDFFDDPYLIALIDSGLNNNQELNIILQELNASQAEIMARKGEYLPRINVNGATGLEKVGRYTSQGANDANTDIRPGEEFPEPLPDFLLSANVSWEVDVWRKLRNAKQSAALNYLASIEGKNFTVTTLIAEIANSYFELVALDVQLDILNQNIQIQKDALKIIKLQKRVGEVTELAVKKFEAEVLKNQSLQYAIKQDIIETENRLRFLIGSNLPSIERNHENFLDKEPTIVNIGIPSQLLENRPDIKQAELMLNASRLDVKSAKANFYPSIRLTSGIGYNAFNPKYLLSTPQSLLYNIAGDFVSPLVNRAGIKAEYVTANSKQIQAAYFYEQTILKAFTEVVSLMYSVDNLQNSFDYKSQQVDALKESISISIVLFKSARADYMEVLMTQRDVLEAKMELVETKREQMNALVNIYQAIGGGWK